jgi:hypothetical protein
MVLWSDGTMVVLLLKGRSIVVFRKPMCQAVYIYNSFDIDTAIRVQIEYILPCLCTSEVFRPTLLYLLPYNCVSGMYQRLTRACTTIYSAAKLVHRNIWKEGHYEKKKKCAPYSHVYNRFRHVQGAAFGFILQARLFCSAGRNLGHTQSSL